MHIFKWLSQKECSQTAHSQNGLQLVSNIWEKWSLPKSWLNFAWEIAIFLLFLGSLQQLHLHFLGFDGVHTPLGLHLLCTKFSIFLTTYPSLNANLICEGSLRSLTQVGRKLKSLNLGNDLRTGINYNLQRGAFNNYMNKKRGRGGQPKVHACPLRGRGGGALNVHGDQNPDIS